MNKITNIDYSKSKDIMSGISLFCRQKTIVGLCCRVKVSACAADFGFGGATGGLLHFTFCADFFPSSDILRVMCIDFRCSAV
jgi:hypothetical protein